MASDRLDPVGSTSARRADRSSSPRTRATSGSKRASPAGGALGRSRRVAVTVLLPGLLADQAGGQKRFELEAPTVGAALRALPVRGPARRQRGELRPLVNVYVDGEDVREQTASTRGFATARRSGRRRHRRRLPSRRVQRCPPAVPGRCRRADSLAPSSARQYLMDRLPLSTTTSYAGPSTSRRSSGESSFRTSARPNRGRPRARFEPDTVVARVVEFHFLRSGCHLSSARP